MNREQAKEILLRYRPDTRDAEDPDVAAALEFARRDPELAAWLAAQIAFQEAARSRLRSVQAPSDLKGRILAAHDRRRIIPLRFPALWAAAAGIVLLLSLALWWTGSHEDLTFNGYRDRMVRTVIRAYALQLQTPDLAEIRRYLAAQQVHADYVLPKGLEQVRGYGCAVMRWQDHKVGMVCFEPAPGQQLYLFVADRTDVPRAPVSTTSSPVLQQVKSMATAAWTDGDKVYLLAGKGDESAVLKYLNP